MRVWIQSKTRCDEVDATQATRSHVTVLVTCQLVAPTKCEKLHLKAYSRFRSSCERISVRSLFVESLLVLDGLMSMQNLGKRCVPSSFDLAAQASRSMPINGPSGACGYLQVLKVPAALTKAEVAPAVSARWALTVTCIHFYSDETAT